MSNNKNYNPLFFHLGVLAATCSQVYFLSDYGVLSPKELQDGAKVLEVVETDSLGNQITDTVFVVPMNITESFRNAVIPLIKDGKLTVEKNKMAPKANF